MSSTNRGAVRQQDDFYSTPSFCVEALLRSCPLPGGRWLEPSAGNGAIIRATTRRDVTWCAVELREEERAGLSALNVVEQVHIGSFLDLPIGERFDVCLANPPYSLALEFIEAAMKHAEVVAMLLRLNFLGSQERAPWHRAHPSDVYILPRRPSFTQHLKAPSQAERCTKKVPNPKKDPEKWERCGRVVDHDGECLTIGTDSVEYGFFVWGPGRGSRWSILEVA